MARRIMVALQAEAQIRAIDAWWRDNREAAPDLFAQENNRPRGLCKMSLGECEKCSAEQHRPGNECNEVQLA